MIPRIKNLIYEKENSLTNNIVINNNNDDLQQQTKSKKFKEIKLYDKTKYNIKTLKEKTDNKSAFNIESDKDIFSDKSAYHFIKDMEQTDIKIDKYELVATDLFNKIKNKQYSDVEHYFDELLVTKEKEDDGIHLILHIYKELSTNYLDVGLDIFDKWCDTSKHHSAFMIIGGYYFYSGYRTRGGSYAADVSSDQFSKYRHKLSLAKNDFMKSYELSNINPIIPMAMLKISKGLSSGRQELNKWYKIGTTIDPSFHYIYREYFAAILPKWGGMPGEAHNFVKKININPPQDSLVYTLKFEEIKEIIASKRYKLNKSEFDNYFSDLEKIVEKFNNEYPHSNKYSVKLLHLKGWCNLNTNLQESEVNFKDALTLNPKHDGSWYGLGYVYTYKPKNQENAYLFNSKAIEINPKESWYYPNRAVIAKSLRLNKQCVNDFSYAIDHGYGNVGDFYRMRAGCYIRVHQKNADKNNLIMALSDYTKALEIKPKPHTYYLRASIHKKLEMYEEAIVDYSGAINLKGDKDYYYLDRAMLYIEIGEYERAIDDAHKVISLNPNNFQAKYIINNYQKEKN